MPFRKPELIPLIFIIFAVTLLTSLGVWQVQRLQWKNNEIAKIAAAQNMAILGTLPQDLNELDYRHVMLTGTYLNDKAFHMVGRPPQTQAENTAGFFIVTPFRLEDDGRVIIVNRGFSPVGKESSPTGTQTLSGIIRPLRHKRMFAPDNQPDKNLWFYEDVSAMSKAAGQELLPLVVEATGKQEKDVYPIPHDGKVVLRNDHLNYAITWFSLAVIGVAMFAFYQRKQDTNASV